MNRKSDSLTGDPTGNRNRKLLRRGGAAAVGAAVLAVALSAHGGGGSSPKKHTAPISAPATVPETTTTTLSPEQRANAYNQEVTEKVKASVQSRMKDLPERILDYGKRHGYGIDIYETGGTAKGAPEEKRDGLNSLTLGGSEQNILVQSYKNRKPGDPTVETSFLLRWNILPNGTRDLVTLHMFQFDHTNESTYKDPELKGFRTLDEISISKTDDGSYGVGYHQISTGATQGERAHIGGPTNEQTTVDPEIVERQLAGFSIVLNQ